MSAVLQDGRLLKDLLRNAAHAFDYIIIETPAVFDVPTVKAMMAADAVVLPLQCEYIALQNIRHTPKNMAVLKKKYRMNFWLLGILLTTDEERVDAYAGEAAQAAHEL